jgi:hydroxypyruvate reductase
MFMTSEQYSASQLRSDAVQIWRAGVDAVLPKALIPRWVRCDSQLLSIGDEHFPLSEVPRLVVIGGGKAGVAMTTAFERAVEDTPWADRLSGWANVPDQPELNQLRTRVNLHAARPLGVNEPTAAGVQGTNEILRIVSSLAPNDLCVVLLSGGGSALLPAPIEGITLADKQAVTRGLMRAGATIQELNLVRKRLSRIKGGGLARAATCRRMIVLAISDVIGDPLDVIASGPAFPDTSTDAEALDILSRLDAVPPRIITALKSPKPPVARIRTKVTHHVIANNRTAVEAAAGEARQLGYDVAMTEWDRPGVAHRLGAEFALKLADLPAAGTTHRHCLISGGEPVIEVTPDRPLRGKGGRNQEIALAATHCRWREGLNGICLVAGGTDGEDGPTDAAGGIADAITWETARALGLDPGRSLSRHDAYAFLEAANGLLKTGLTGTNVMDLRVGLACSE